MMKNKIWMGLICGLLAPFLFIVLFYLLRFNDLTVSDFIQQSIVLKVHLKIIAVGVFFADLGLFYLFMWKKKNDAAKGVILSVFLFFFIFLILSF